MKIGILTFHWATNYGAVLQAYALQEYLKHMGHDVKIINYVPSEISFKNCFRFRNPKNIWFQLMNLQKEKLFRPFRNRWLEQTKKYTSLDHLIQDSPKMDAYVCGSDQVWNPYFLENGERKITPTYFLPFGNESTLRIAYAVSFGVENYPEKLIKLALPYIKQFNYLSAREISGKKILEKLNLDTHVAVMPDPSLLLSKKSLESLVHNTKKKELDSFFYILQENQSIINKLAVFAQKELNLKVVSNSKNHLFGIEDWLSYIKGTTNVITNSFHGVIFSLLFNKPFIVVPIENRLKGMNDRIFTLLSMFNLEDQLLDVYDESRFQNILQNSIDWEEIEIKKKFLQKEAQSFLVNALKRS